MSSVDFGSNRRKIYAKWEHRETPIDGYTDFRQQK